MAEALTKNLSCGLRDGKVHLIARKSIGRRYITKCGETIDRDELLVFAQSPDAITCPECKK